MTQVAEINKGDKFWCSHRRLPSDMIGTVIVMTDEPGKLIGLEFDKDIDGHSCDGRGKDGCCLWVNVDHILTNDEYQSRELAKKLASPYSELPKIVLKPNGT